MGGTVAYGSPWRGAAYTAFHPQQPLLLRSCSKLDAKVVPCRQLYNGAHSLKRSAVRPCTSTWWPCMTGLRAAVAGRPVRAVPPVPAGAQGGAAAPLHGGPLPATALGHGGAAAPSHAGIRPAPAVRHGGAAPPFHGRPQAPPQGGRGGEGAAGQGWRTPGVSRVLIRFRCGSVLLPARHVLCEVDILGLHEWLLAYFMFVVGDPSDNCILAARITTFQ